MRYTEEIKQNAKALYLQHYDMEEIREKLALNNTRILYRWRDKEDWDALLSHETVEAATAKRYLKLLDTENKTHGQLREIEILGEQLLKFLKLKNTEKISYSEKTNRNAKNGKNRKKKNDISELTEDDFNRVANELLFGYQHLWREKSKDPSIRDRFILKSRQIGATFYFAFEAFEKACMTGKNQIFISASRRQAEVFRAYIIAFAKKYFELELTGNPIVLSNDAQLLFLSTNIATAQSEHGDIYFDEVFWTRNFDELYEVASPMAAQKEYSTTMFSTPSAISHDAYKYWSGEKRNEGRKKEEHISLDVSHKALKNGRYDASDRTWRHIVSIYDAEEQGCNLFDIDYLQAKYTPQRFNNLFCCHFIDNSESVFSLQALLNCAADSSQWKYVDRKAERPYGNRGVLVGYDPSRKDRDKAEIVALTDPVNIKDKFRLIDRMSMNNTPGPQQIAVIKDWHENKYNISFLGVDSTGVGVFVLDNVLEIYPTATPIDYANPDTKNRLVQKALSVIAQKRFEYDVDDVDVPMAFLSIRQTATQNGKIVYVTDYNEDTGHGDVAWAIMKAMFKESLSIEYQRKSSVTFAH